MTKNKSQTRLPQLKALVERAPWVLRITEHKDKPVPILIVKERLPLSGENEKRNNPALNSNAGLKERGLLYGQSLRRCLPAVRFIMGGLSDEAGIPLELQSFFDRDRITFRGNLPLDDAVGAKLSLIFKLQERVKDLDRVELIAWRVARFSREEALYWLTRATQYGAAANRWAHAGMRLMLGGQPGDRAVRQMLEREIR